MHRLNRKERWHITVHEVSTDLYEVIINDDDDHLQEEYKAIRKEAVPEGHYTYDVVAEDFNDNKVTILWLARPINPLLC